MVDPKVRLTIEVRGATMRSSQLCEKNSKYYDTNTITVVGHPSKGKTKKYTYAVQTRSCVPAKQCISISKETYQYMISYSGNEPSFHIKQNRWINITNKERLNMHMKAIAEYLGGEGAKYNFEVID